MPAVWCPGARSRSRLTNTRASGRCAIFAVHRCCLSPVRERPQGISGAHDCSSWAGILCDAVIISAEFDGESSLPVCGTGPQAARQSWKSSGGRIGNGVALRDRRALRPSRIRAASDCGRPLGEIRTFVCRATRHRGLRAPCRRAPWRKRLRWRLGRP